MSRLERSTEKCRPAPPPPLRAVYLSAAHITHWETNINFLAPHPAPPVLLLRLQFTLCLRLCFMSQFFIFFPSFSTWLGSYICHKVVSGCQTQGWWDLKNGCECLAEVLKRNRVTFCHVISFCPFCLSVTMNELEVNVVLHYITLLFL